MPVMKSPFDIIVKFNPEEHAMMLKTNIDSHETMLEVVPLGGNMFKINFDHEVVAEFLAGNKQVEILRKSCS